MGPGEKALKAKYRPFAIENAGGFILATEHAIRLLDDIESLDLTLEGIDGYRIEGDEMGDSSKDSVSFLVSDLRATELTGRTRFEKARSFIVQHSRPGIFFDVLFSDTSEVVH